MRQTHKIKDNVKFKKLIQSAAFELTDSQEAESEFSEEDQYKDFKKSLHRHGVRDIQASMYRNQERDNSDDEWMNEAVVDVCNKRIMERERGH